MKELSMLSFRRLKILIVVFFLGAPIPAWAQDSEKLYQKLDGLSAQQRQQVLVEGAKREGSLTLYAVFVREMIEQLLATFSKKYPFIKTQFIREGRGEALADRYLTEYRAGRHITDVFAGGDNVVLSFTEADVLAKYRSPEWKYFPKDYKDKDGRWTTVFISEWAFGYNTRHIDRKRLPKTYLDLLDPYWKDKIGLDPLPNNFIRGALKAFGKEKAQDFFQKLVETQNIQFRRGRTLQVQLLAAGEIYSSPELRLSLLKELKQKGAPVDYHFAYPFVVTLAAAGAFKTAPHPHAAALFIDFVLSKEGQQFLVDREFTVMREGMTKLDQDGIKNMVPLDLEFRKSSDDLVEKIAKETFARRSRVR
jgi:iron(III) transport system substrate-binding protein